MMNQHSLWPLQVFRVPELVCWCQL